MQSRAKSPASHKGKLEKAELLESNALEEEIEDLAGCRLIFNTNPDVAAFLSSGILREHFNVDWERTKFHYPVPMASEKPRLFIPNNFVVELKSGIEDVCRRSCMNAFGTTEKQPASPSMGNDIEVTAARDGLNEAILAISVCANTSSDDLVTFPSFCLLLEQLGKARPEIVLSYLDRLDTRIETQEGMFNVRRNFRVRLR